MPFFQSLALRHLIKKTLESEGMKPEVAAYIGSVASLHTVATFADYHAHLALSQESQEKILEAIDFELNSEAANQITTVEKEYDSTLNNLDSNKIEEIFSKIDLAQARITKDQEEIQSLAKETDELLNQLKYKAS